MRTPLQLAKEIDRRDLLGGPVRLCGGREYGAGATGWYYSLSHSLCSIADAVLDRSCGYQHRGEAADNVRGPFHSRIAALRDLAEWLEDDDGRAWAEAAIAENDAALDFALHADDRRRATRRAKRARYRAGRRARGLPVHHEQ